MHSHFDALCHVSYKSKLYNGVPTNAVTSKGARQLDISQYRNGIVGKGVLIDIPRLRKAKWLEPGEAVTVGEIEAAEKEEGVRLGEGDIFVFRVGHVRRRQELGPWNVNEDGEGRAGLRPEVMRLLHERKVAAFLPDADGETVPSTVEGIVHPVHALQIAAMGLACGDSLQLEDLAKACEEESTWEFMVTVAPLNIVGATGSLVNPLAIF
jgi:kynurenine formamidase